MPKNSFPLFPQLSNGKSGKSEPQGFQAFFSSFPQLSTRNRMESRGTHRETPMDRAFQLSTSFHPLKGVLPAVESGIPPGGFAAFGEAFFSCKAERTIIEKKHTPSPAKKTQRGLKMIRPTDEITH